MKWEKKINLSLIYIFQKLLKFRLNIRCRFVSDLQLVPCIFGILQPRLDLTNFDTSRMSLKWLILLFFNLYFYQTLTLYLLICFLHLPEYLQLRLDPFLISLNFDLICSLFYTLRKDHWNTNSRIICLQDQKVLVICNCQYILLLRI